jgi:hypothetical protein
VNDKTRKPDGPDARGRVVTGEPTTGVTRAGGAESAAEDGATSPAGAETPNGATPSAGVPAEDIAVPAASGHGEDGPAAAAAGDEEPPASSRPDPAGPEAVTTQMRLPISDNGSAPRPVPGAPGDVPVTAVPGTADAPRPVEGAGARSEAPRPSPVPSARRPVSASTPAPGQAASPPPWHRMPGQQAQEQRAHPNERPAGGLLEEAPTTFLEPPARPDHPSDAEESSSDSKAWPAGRPRRNRPPRQAALQLKRLDPWSVLKLGLVLAVVLFFIWMVAIGVLYGVLDGMGVWDRLNGTYADLVSGEAPTGSPLISAGRVFGLAAVIGAINSLLFAVAITIGAFVYNVSADLVGGIEVTLSERD